jgi:ribosomal protein RSM22 (predicted rRNA methylase)
MRLPEELRRAVEHEVEKVDRPRLVQACAQLTQQYQAGNFSSPAIRSEAHRAAYLAVRAPATFSANLRVFSEIRQLAPEASIGSILDLGAGPGTALYAAAEVFPSLLQATLVEEDASLIAIGQSISAHSVHEAARQANWLRQDLRAGLSLEHHDLVVISYTLGELPQTHVERVISQAWACAKEFLVVLEPGTRRGFGVVHAARSALIGCGAHLLAPCPHAAECPMAAGGDWCHFSQRVERTSEHRQLKGGALGYEDEKFSYVVASRKQFLPATARIVRHPQKHGGHVQLRLCTLNGLENRTVTKSQKEDYRKARKAEWGERWEDREVKTLR